MSTDSRGMDFVNARFETLVEELGKTRVLELILKGQKWEESMRKRQDYQKERMTDPSVAAKIKEQRREYQKRRNAMIKEAVEFYRSQDE